MQVTSIHPVLGAVARPVAPAAPPAAPTIEQLRAELQDPFAFVAGAGCPWAGGKPPKG